MRERRGLVWLGVAIALAVGLVVIQRELRRDPEPYFEDDSLPEGSRADDEERPRADDEARAIEPIETPPRELRREVEEEPSPSPPDGDPEVPLDCEHPFVPSARGEWRRYRWQQSGEERSAELRVESLGVREVEGEREVRWRMTVTDAADASELASERMTTRCTPGREAEEPWFGILERSLGLTLSSARGRWRWPAELARGDRFEGTAIFDTTDAEMRAPDGTGGSRVLRVTRNHVVGEREAVRVPAGRFEAWRVDYEEQHAFGERGERGTGRVWVAPEVGMVRSTAENSQGIVQTIELLSRGRSSR